MVEVTEMYCSYSAHKHEATFCLIRYEISTYWQEGKTTAEASVYRKSYRVVRETPACYVIDNYGQEEFVRKEQSGKRFAYVEDEDAFNSLKARVKWRTVHANNSVKSALAATELFNTFELERKAT